jgi:ubiquinone/menaquinone biosynthesis C-methylase UbiE
VREDAQEEFYELEDSGERFLPGVEGKAEIAYDHLVRYRFAGRFLEGKKVADLGSGSGYGSYSLSKVAREVKALDLSDEAVAHASSHYVEPNLSYQIGDVTRLPFEDGSFDAATSFEVIEHLDDPEKLAVEAKRVVKDDGIFIVSTPDKQTYSNDRNAVNLYHSREMYAPEFKEMLERHFEHVDIYRQGAISGSLITRNPEELNPDGRAEMESAPFSLEEPDFGPEVPITLYIIAVCTNGPPPEPLTYPYLVLDRDRLIYEDYEQRYVKVRRLMLAARYHRSRARELSEALSGSPQTAKRLENQLQRLKNQLQRLESQLQNTRKHNDQLKAHNQKIERRLHAIEDSRSWRVIQKLGPMKARLLRLMKRG